MRHRSKTRRVLKWAGTVLCGLIVTMAFLSVKYSLYVETRSEYILDVQIGNVMVHWPRKGTPLRLNRPAVYARVSPIDPPYRLRSLLGSARYYPRIQVTQPPGGFLNVDGPDPLFDGALRTPCWTLFLVAAAPTALLWWRDRRYPPGHCQTCGYDLTGNVSGRCPECGTPVPPTAGDAPAAATLRKAPPWLVNPFVRTGSSRASASAGRRSIRQ